MASLSLTAIGMCRAAGIQNRLMVPSDRLNMGIRSQRVLPSTLATERPDMRHWENYLASLSLTAIGFVLRSGTFKAG